MLIVNQLAGDTKGNKAETCYFFSIKNFCLQPSAFAPVAPLFSRHTVTFVANQALTKVRPVTFPVTTVTLPVTNPLQFRLVTPHHLPSCGC